jgi:glycerol-3-phosphate dehydrogenase
VRRISIEIEVKNNERFQEVVKKVKGAVDIFGDDVTVKVRPAMELSAEERKVLVAVKTLQDRKVEANIFSIGMEIGGMKNAHIISELMQKGLVKSGDHGTYGLTEAGLKEVTRIIEEKKEERKGSHRL